MAIGEEKQSLAELLEALERVKYNIENQTTSEKIQQSDKDLAITLWNKIEAIGGSMSNSLLDRAVITDSAEEDAGAYNSNKVGHVSLATDVQAKAGYPKPIGRAIAVQPSQLPTVDSTDQIILPAGDITYQGETIDISVGGAGRNEYNIGLTSGFKNLIESITQQLNIINSNNSNNSNVLLGSIVPWLSDIIPTDYLLLDGQEVSQTTYSTLYTLLGDVYGTPGTNGNFILPDLRGRALKGYKLNGGELPYVNENNVISYPSQSPGQLEVGSQVGLENVSISASMLPVHTHSAGDNLTTNQAGEHTHPYTLYKSSPAFPSGGTDSFANGDNSTGADNDNLVIQAAGAHSHTVTGYTGDNSTSSRELQITNPAMLVNYLIRAL